MQKEGKKKMKHDRSKERTKGIEKNVNENKERHGRQKNDY